MPCEFYELYAVHTEWPPIVLKTGTPGKISEFDFFNEMSEN